MDKIREQEPGEPYFDPLIIANKREKYYNIRVSAISCRPDAMYLWAHVLEGVDI